MITVDRNLFQLATASSCYWFRVTEHGHVEHLHYGRRLPAAQDPAALAVKRTAVIGGTIPYTEDDELYALETMCLEWSGVGRGDYRTSPVQVVGGDGAYACDFTYRKHHVQSGPMVTEDLPGPTADPDQAQTLVIELADDAAGLGLTLEYTVFVDCDVIARRATLRNKGSKPVSVRALSSLMVDLPAPDLRVLSLSGAWIKESHLDDRPLGQDTVVISSTTGVSSNLHNPGFMLAERAGTETQGDAYGFNLVYSGNHRSTIERDHRDVVRVTVGINPTGFDQELAPGQSFESPQAVMTYSHSGIGQASRNFHDFVNQHIVRGAWRGRPRPVVYNNWEATFFNFTADRLLDLARQAKDLGTELFVLDDGWFGQRDNDHTGLGDYDVNVNKFPRGLPHFADRIRDLGLGFGIWVEPEMVNPDSDLFRAHPSWAVTTPGRQPSLGRHQLILDLTQAVVRDHIVDKVGRLIDDTGVDYVKWDFNRPFTDTFSPRIADQGEFAHRYMLGLYEVLRRIFWTRPHVLLESCASGGNRFDLGMLCFSPQIWASDDTDAIERLSIQAGLSLLYPPSTMGAHVSEAPHQQTLRNTPLATRFNVAAFGCLGYELDLDRLDEAERDEIRRQIEFYIAHRSTLQYGRLHRTDRACGAKPNKVVWTMTEPDQSEAITGLYQTLSQASEGFDQLPVEGLAPDGHYRVQTYPQTLSVAALGSLIKHVLPDVVLPPHFRLPDTIEQYDAYGVTLEDGIFLANQYMGTGYNEHIRVLGDFGSNLYLTTRLPAD
ncbi:MAG: alpha-galactosidase [Propionibacteriaceae bacterium]|jgi:alpha-galactosidase|nr:alpha-galactosidase [Propionibacteriaceae bacterium]